MNRGAWAGGRQGGCREWVSLEGQAPHGGDCGLGWGWVTSPYPGVLTFEPERRHWVRLGWGWITSTHPGVLTWEPERRHRGQAGPGRPRASNKICCHLPETPARRVHVW